MKQFDTKKENKNYASFKMWEIVTIVIITSVVSFLTTGIIVNNNYRTTNGISYNELLSDSKVKEFLEVYANVVAGYYEDVDKDEAINMAINGMMSYLGDKYTTYMDQDEAQKLADELKGTYEGIGVSVSKENVGQIYEVFEDSPAAQAGVKEGDIIVAVNNEDVTSKTNDEIVALIQASNDKKVDIKVLRENNYYDFTIKIGTLNVPAISYEIKENNNKKIGYIYLATFSSSLASQVEKALTKMETTGIDGLIIDVRDNGGGYLSAASETASLFLEKGQKIYSLETKDGIEDYKDETDTHRTYPIMVIMNGATASAAEILTTALVDSYNAKTLGTQSYGKGKVQQTMSLDDGSLVKYTSSRWLRPNGDCIDDFGISPTYKVDLEIKKDENGKIIEVIDRQLEKALKIMSGEDTN